MSTSPRSGFGSGTSRHSRTSGPPPRVISMARIRTTVTGQTTSGLPAFPEALGVNLQGICYPFIPTRGGTTVARQDREESLEEQLAWLDAIKESEEAPVRVSAKTGPGVPSDETAVVSPYPQDPWAEVPQHDPPTPPLFRAAIDSVYGTEAGPEPAERRAPEPPADDSADTKPAIDDAVLAPLRPLPRPDDTDSYSLSSFRDPEPPDDQTVENLAWPTPPAWTSDDRAGTQGESTPDSPRPEDADDSRLSGGDSDGSRPTAG